jgi:hypothetical protein
MESRNEEIKIVAVNCGNKFPCGYLIREYWRRRWGERNVVVVRIKTPREGEKSGDKEERWRVGFAPNVKLETREVSVFE